MNRRVPPHPCARCGEPVLGLVGQDDFFPAYHVPEAQIADLRAHGALDWVHARCLVDSGYASFWTERRVVVLGQLGGTTELHRSERVAILADARTEQLIIVTNGTEARLPRAALEAMKIEADHLRLPVEHELDLDLSGQAALAGEIGQALETAGSFPLPAIVATFGVSARMIEPRALEGGVIAPLPGEPAVTRGGLAKKALAAWARYELALPPAAERALRGELELLS